MPLFTYSNLVKALLFITLFILGLPLDGQLGRFSIGSMYVGDGAVPASAVEEISKTNTMIFWLIIYLLAFLVFIRKSKHAYFLIKIIPLYLIFLLYLFMSTFWSTEPFNGVFELFQLLATTLVCSIIVFYYRNKPYQLIQHAALALGAAQFISFLLVVIAPSLAIPPNGRWVGMYGAPNYFGALAFCSLCVNAAVLRVLKPLSSRVNVLFVLVSLCNLLGTNSVTSALCACIALGGMFVWPYLFGPGPSAHKNQLLLALFCMFLALLYFVGVIDFLITEGLSSSGRSTNLSGRSEIWAEAISAISNNFILGHGYGTKPQLVSIPRLHDLHSSYLTILYSGGVVAFALFLLSLLHVARSIFLLNSIDLVLCRIVAPIFFTTLIYSISETALVRPRSPIFVMFILMILLIQINVYKRRYKL
jgi:O-antigen ligase